jgi:lipopolysaccharide transport system ATP-binding protein
MSDIAIKVEELNKLYHIGGKKQYALKDSIGNLFKSKKNDKETEFWALKDVSFELKKGDVLGVIGRNGAGKSTLLKILSRITEPTGGRIEIDGRISSLLEVGTGFHPELSGRENIFLNGTILGMKRKEIKDKFDEIVDFSGVKKFLDTPVKHYSSGMYVRLAFAVAAHLEPEILIIDEVLAVGDQEFQKKCIGKMKEVANVGRTVIFVSHSMSAISALCTRGLYLKSGKVEFSGEIGGAIEKYLNLGNLKEAEVDLLNYAVRQGNQAIGMLTGISLYSMQNTPVNIFRIGESIIVKISFKIKEFIRNLEIGFAIIDSSGVTRQLFVSNWEGVKSEFDKGEHVLHCNIPEILIFPGIYSISCWIKRQGDFISDQVDNPIAFEVIGKDTTGFNPYFERYKHGGTFQRSTWKMS